jgi:putative spermidine/putrescine transport system substrate-binding protein
MALGLGASLAPAGLEKEGNMKLGLSIRRLGLVVIGFIFVSACGGSSTSSSACPAKTATSAADCGGIDGLYAAAKAEGTLNVIALPLDWANWGEIIPAFKAKYPGIKVLSTNPQGSSQEEIDAINQLAGTSGAPDVVDVGMKVMLANTQLFSPYKVSTWNDIPTAQKDPAGVWFQDYGGYMGIGYDPTKVPGGTINAMADLLGSGFKGKVALAGDPTISNQALNGVIMASVANGGSLDDVSKGVDFFRQLKVAGNFVPVKGSGATVKSGQTPVLFEWDYLSAAHTKDVSGWKVFVPANATIGGYYAQGINKGAPHPAAARLWEEFLYSDQGQNLFLKGSARPVRQAAMEKSGKIDTTALAALPKVAGTPVFPTQAQSAAASTYLSTKWAQAIA